MHVGDILGQFYCYDGLFAVVNFSKKTGDFASLSAVDLRVLALVYLLEKENVGTDHIRTEPTRQVVIYRHFLICRCSPLINVCKCLVVYFSWGIDFGIIELLNPFPIYKNLHPSPHIHLILPQQAL